MVQRKINSEEGYTVVEVLVAVTIVSILMAIVGTVFIFAYAQVNRWHTNLSLNSEKELIIQRLYQDIQDAQSIANTDSGFVITDYTNSEFVYHTRDEVLTRNTIPLVTAYDSVYIERMVLSDTLNVIDIRFYHDEEEWRTQIFQSTRKPKNWEPLK